MGKRRGRHPEKNLSAAKVKSLSNPGRYCDGNGLYLVVTPSGSKRWIVRIMIRGGRTDLGLGRANLVPVAAARSRAVTLLEEVRRGVDPRVTKKLAKGTPTFEEASAIVFEQNKKGWKNRKHVDQWINTLRTYAFPTIGRMKVNDIGSPEILRLLSPIWLSKHETASRVRQRIKVVLDWAKTAGHRQGDNPADAVVNGLPSHKRIKRHQTALPYRFVPTFVANIGSLPNGIYVRLALKFLILTATRTNEVLQMRWDEVFEDVWTLPADRTKSARAFRIPLPPQALEILKIARVHSGESRFVFPSQDAGKPLSNMTLLMAIRRVGMSITTHGFRSSFSDWAHETTNHENIVIEMALNHSVRSKTEAAYRRGDLIEKRRKLMANWADFVLSSPTATYDP